MTDDLVKRLREACFLAFDDNTNDYHSAEEAASRIEQLEAALREIAMLHFRSDTDFENDARDANEIATRALAATSKKSLPVGKPDLPTERPPGCKYEPCRGMRTGFCDCNWSAT